VANPLSIVKTDTAHVTATVEQITHDEDLFDLTLTSSGITHQDDRMVIRGDAGDVGGLLMKLLAELTETPILAELTADEVACALVTLGEVHRIHGELPDPYDELSGSQTDVAQKLDDLTADPTCQQCGQEDITDDENKIGPRCIDYNLSRCS
jgi:hypothetical protein